MSQQKGERAKRQKILRDTEMPCLLESVPNTDFFIDIEGTVKCIVN